jgi:alpha-galactosidase/6-phospho-beta-glucosidase family protein
MGANRSVDEDHSSEKGQRPPFTGKMTHPKAFAGLLMNQVAVNDLTTEAVLTGSKEVVMQALLVDPVVNSV